MVKKFRIISITFLLVDKRFSENFSQFSGRDSLEVFFVFFVGNVNDKSRRSYRHHIAVCNTARSRSLNNSWRRNVPVRLGLSLTVSIGRLPFSFTLMMQWRRSMLMSLVSMGISTSVPFDARPIILSPACKGNSCRYPNAFSNTVMKPREVSMSFLWHASISGSVIRNRLRQAGQMKDMLQEAS